MTFWITMAMLTTAPGLATFGWHILHGNSIESRGKKLFVPLRWIAELDGAMDVSMTKLPLTILRGARFDGSISVGPWVAPHNQRTEEIYKSWETVYWNLADPGAAVSGPLRSGTGAHEIFCMQSSYTGPSAHSSASCLVLQGKWRADFRGNENDLETFFDIVRRID